MVGKYKIASLSAMTNLIDTTEALFPPGAEYVDVGALQDIKVSVYASNGVRVQVEWAPESDFNGIGPATIIRCGANQWACQKCETIMPYARIRVVNETGRPCNTLILHSWSVETPNTVVHSHTHSGHVPVGHGPPLADVPEPKKGLSRFVPRPKAPPAKETLLYRDDRLPEYIPPGALLMGGEKGRIIALPKGNMNDRLIVGEKGPVYRSEFDVLSDL
jgi:hypothetical protein